MSKFEKETVYDEKSGTKIVSLKPIEDSLKDKAKTAMQIHVALCAEGQKLCPPESKWVPLSDANQETAIQVEKVKDVLQIKIEALQLAILSIYKPQITILEKKHEVLKQKLRNHIKALPSGIIEVGGITIGNLLLLKQWFETLEGLLG